MDPGAGYPAPPPVGFEMQQPPPLGKDGTLYNGLQLIQVDTECGW